MAVSIAGRTAWSDDTWSYLNDPRMPAMEHGWKLHVSARPGDLDTVTGLVLPVLSRYVCHAKFARDPETLRRLNSGTVSAGAVGKAITVYPLPGTVVEVARDLAAVLRDREGPRVVSDRRVDPRAPVYYRYGPFTGDYRTGRSGRLESVMTAPDGRVFDGLAVGRYRCPPWAEDPFETASGPGTAPSAPGLGGGRYTVTAGIARAAHGNVYRALDTTLGRPVVVKQARAFVGEDESGTDARHRLRNEHTVLTALDGVPGVPRALDYFAHRSDEYLVMSGCGDRNLRREILRNGPYQDDGARPGRALSVLAVRLLRVLDAIHGRNVVVRDLKPDNVVLDASGPGHCHVIDFGISECAGAGPGGATPGYSEPVLRAAGPAAPADDHYALGATLFFAATGMDPVIVDTDHEVNRDRTLACLSWALPGRAHREIRSTITGLLSFEAAVRTAAADRLRTGTAGAARRPARRTTHPRVDRDLLDEIIEHTTDFCAGEAEAIVDPVRAAQLNVPTSVDVYGGSSGLGLELLHHAHRPRVRAAVTGLARWTAEQSRNLPPGLYTGRTGVQLFLAEAEAEAGSGEGPGEAPGTDADGRSAHPDLPDRGPDGGPPEADLIAGVAGVGLGRVLLARHALRSGHRQAADRHLAVAADCDRMLASGAARLTPAGSDTAGSAALREGVAHGEAGVVGFLLEHSFLLDHDGATGAAEAAGRAEKAAARLAAVTPDIIAAAAEPGATRRYGSWCRGLAGIGTVLVRAAERLDEPRYLHLAQRAARACAALAPRMPLVTQCCGLAGVGDLMVDVAEASASEEFRDAAETVALLILSRSGGTWSRPVFPDAGLARSSATWAGGSAGVLAFFRRLRDRGGPRLGLVA
ncbi:serine/threonine protein kinase [Streptomyces sp. GMY01]|uniref:class IV lanthionine synthetase LanL n=1 Tax=Streptomyces sp. GMY02 TaxID=1333528 RepID=UPI00146EFDEF|nr:class IV lanthionine synthetase LanL [Streptomyces sp. GMY02]NMO35009.1 serine/threonine protein kinase [Streptomyces sp. GMY02]